MNISKDLEKMTNRERVEDLGRIAEIIDQINNQDNVFDTYQGRTKDFPQWFMNKTTDEQYDILYKIIYYIKGLESNLADCYQIARWGDDVKED